MIVIKKLQTMNITKKSLDELTYAVIGCAIEVHKHLGPGLLESVYERCLVEEFTQRGIKFQKQLIVPVHYKGLYLDADLRLDLLAEDVLCIELKAQEGLLPIHDAVLLTYMKLLQKPKGLLLNFHCKNIFKEGQKTLVNEYFSALPDE